MEVLLADYLGFCYGVKRAIKIARGHASANQCVCTLGPIIHNPQMVERLRQEGVGTADSLEEIPKDGTIIIRSHGVGPQVYKEAERKGFCLVDATCPHVKKAQMSAQMLLRDGYTVVIIGEKKHPEVRSISEWADGKAQIIDTEEEAQELLPAERLGIVCQTTLSGEKFRKIATILLSKARDIRILRTICTATDQRQAAAQELAGRVDLMLVIGGRNSANTTRLYNLCRKKCLAYHIETADELQDTWFDKIQKIGITAGASTPGWIIKEVYDKCQNR